jgi:RluA family pseudouridine synthase
VHEPRILFEDSGWLAVDKPSGVVVIPARGEDPAASLWRRLELLRGERLWVVHRIDRQTSGVLVLARTEEAHRIWSVAFQNGRVEKTYLAFTQGIPARGEIRAPLIEDGRGRMRVAGPEERGKPARSLVSITRSWPAAGVALVQVEPRTGRQHQIRVHLAHDGAPILGDPIYGEPPPEALGLERLALHASRLIGPPDLGSTEVTSPLPADFVAAMRALDGRR